MNKLHVGTPAVSKYHQLKRFFLSDEGPDFADHDFPLRGYLITPSGYMCLEWESEEANDEEQTIDPIFTEIAESDVTMQKKVTRIKKTPM